MRECPACTQPVPDGNRFCGQCGARMPEAPEPSPLPGTAPLLRGVRREVTVVFVDVTNFTAASRTLDSEEVFVWMDETMGVLAGIIDRYEGSIDKFTGDGLMALFGVPDAHENDPERAVLAALDMQAAIQPLRERVRQAYQLDFQIRIGVNTGSVIAGNVGGEAHSEYTVLGDTVNLASRLEKAAEPGSVLVSADTYGRTAPLFRYYALPPLNVKGVPDPLQTYRPLGPADQPGSVRGIAGLHAPMIGRGVALEQLRTMLDDVCHMRRSQIALITGEAGFGKSRLVAEFRASLARENVLYHQGVCLAHTRFTPFWVIADLLRHILCIAITDPDALQTGRLYDYLYRSGLPADDLAPYLATVLGLNISEEAATRLAQLDAAMLQRQIHAAVRQIVLAEAAVAPTVLVFDDLHWLDPASRDLLAYLLQSSGDAPLALVLVTRDANDQETVRPLIEGLGREMGKVAHIVLQALSDEESRQLVSHLLGLRGGAGASLAGQLVGRGEGNPFYTEEIIRTLIDRGGLVETADGWAPTPHVAELLQTVPTNLKGLILARFDRLKPELQTLLRYAAVVGRTFPARLIKAVVTATPEQLAAQLHELVNRRFLSAEPFGNDDGFVFQHMLVQDAIYETLMRRDRQQIHEHIARVIQGDVFWPPDQQTEVLAYHYVESASPARAIPLLVTAAENAARRYANETAIRHYRQALALMQEYPAGYGALVFTLRIGLGRALKFVGSFEEAGQILTEALDRLQIASLERALWLATLVEVLGELADVRMREGALERAVAHLETGLTALGADGPQNYPQAWRRLMNRLASVRLRQGNLEQTYALANSATIDADPSNDPITLASLYGLLGGVLYEQGHADEAINYVERSLALYRSLGYTPGMANAYANLGVLYYGQGLWQRAVESLEQANVLRREIGYMPEQALTLGNLALVRMAMGDHARAREDLERSLVISGQLGDDFGEIRAEIGLGHLAVIQECYEDAAERIERVMQNLDAAGEDGAVQAHWLLALVRAECGTLEEGIALAEKSLEMARAAGLSEQEAECLRVLGRLRGQAGASGEAEHLLREAIVLAGQRSDPYQRGLAMLELGRLYLMRSNAVPAARATLTEAAALFERLDAAHDLARARRAIERINIS